MDTIQIPFGFIKEGKIFQNSWGEHPDREIGEVRDDDTKKSAQFFQERFSELEKSINEVTEKVDSLENKGSFLMKLVHLREHLAQHEGLGDYQILHDRIIKYESLIRDIIQKNRTRNTEIKTILIEEAKAAIELVNWQKATEQINDVKSRWIKTGSAEEDKNGFLEESFRKLTKAFFDRKKQFYEDKEKLVEHRKRQYEEIIADSKKLSNLQKEERFKKIKELKEKWREVGGIPSESYKSLNTAFHQSLKEKKQDIPVDYSQTLAKLEAIKEGKEPYNKQEIDQTRKKLLSDQTKNQNKFKCVELIQLLNERDFVIKLADKRVSNFASLDKEKQKGICKEIIYRLISRDEEELNLYEENATKFSSSDGKMNKLVENKVKGQQRKIKIKSNLMEWINDGIF